MALAGGVSGSVFGPGGVIASGSAWFAVGANEARKRTMKQRLKYRCLSCSYSGRPA